MREAILVAMHDSRNVVYVEDRNYKLVADRLAPRHRSLLRGITRITCHWWGDRNTIEMYVEMGDDKSTTLLYQGSYTAILMPEPPPAAADAFVSGEMLFPADAIREWGESE